MKLKVLIALCSATAVLAQEEEAPPPVEEVAEVEGVEELEEVTEEEPVVVSEEGDDTVDVVSDEKLPFENPMMESIGTVLMVILIALSNAGGLSGAGSNIPIMLIFFDMDMSQAVPISAFVAVCATVFRFTFNFKLRHPKRVERNAINYEIVQLTMPCVFLGSFLGVLIGKIIGETW
jgi:hypothetical protein